MAEKTLFLGLARQHFWLTSPETSFKRTPIARPDEMGGCNLGEAVPQGTWPHAIRTLPFFMVVVSCPELYMAK